MNSLFTFLRNAVLVLTGWSAAKIIHQQMLNRVINAPINLYFDITPIGRILNRFSKDLSIMDT
jgi:ABC-type multidrug transport system fused ATPase/permease subunit